MKNKILFDFKEDMIMIGIILVFSIICGIIMDVVAVKGGSSTDYFVSTLIVIGGFCALSFIGGMYFKRKFNIHISMSGKRSELIISELIVFTIECLILYLLSFLALLIEDRILLWLGVGTGLDGYTAVDSIFDSGAKLGYSLTSYKHINGFTTNCFGETGAYVRFTPWHNDVVYIDFKAMGDFGFGKNLLRWAEVGIQPAIRFRLGGRFDLAANLGLLGARYGVGNSFNLVDGEYDMAANEWRGGLILGNNLSLSLYYNF